MAGIGMVLGMLVGALVGAIPILGVVLGPLITPLAAAFGLLRGAFEDFKNKSLQHRIEEAVSQYAPLKGEVMSLNDELNDFFAKEEEQIIDQPILFKEKLGIGEKAYAFLRYRENLTTFSEAIGIGAAASGIASSSMVASTFFAPASSGFIASALSTVGLAPQLPHRWGGLLARVLLLAAPLLASPDSSNPQKKMDGSDPEVH